jgi:hypothetical protein
VTVEVFGTGAARHPVTVDLRGASGAELGTATRTLLVGHRPRTVSVGLSAVGRRALAGHREVQVHARVEIDSRGGTGDRTSQLLLRRR